MAGEYDYEGANSGACESYCTPMDSRREAAAYAKHKQLAYVKPLTDEEVEESFKQIKPVYSEKDLRRMAAIRARHQMFRAQRKNNK